MANTTRSGERGTGERRPIGADATPVPRLEPRIVRPPAAHRARTPGEAEYELSELREELVQDRERRMPEGESPKRWQTTMSVIALSAAALFMISSIALVLARYFGWAALALGTVLVVLYVVIGGGAEWLAARLRMLDYREAEEEVTVRMRDLDRPPPDEPV